MNTLTDGLTVIVKRDCPTCVLVEPILGQLAAGEIPLTVYSQDDPTFPGNIPGVVDDTSLEVSYHLNIETVPTLIRVKQGNEVERIVGWNREEWKTFTGLTAGLLDISKPRGNIFLDRIALQLAGRGLTIKRYQKPTYARVAPTELQQKIAAECDLAIEALAD